LNPGPATLAVRRAMALLFLASPLFLLSETFADPDLWGHLRFGQDILRTGSIAEHDPYSYLSHGQSWINHEWLAEVLFALAYEAGGSPGLILLKTSICFGALGLVWRHVASKGLPFVEAGMFTLFVVGVAMPWMAPVRPQIFSYLLFSVVLVVLDRVRSGRVGGLIFLPVVFALWANLHGGFLAGLAILAVWSAGRMVLARPPRREVGLLALATIGSLLAVLLTPYGWRLPALLLRTATVPRPEIADWQPLQLAGPEGGITVLVLVAMIGVIAASRRRRDCGSLVVLALVGAGPFVAHRHLPLAMLTLAVFSAEHAADLRRRFASPVEESPPRTAWPVAGLIAAFGLALVVAAVPHFASIRLMGPALQFPARGIAALKAARIRGNLAVPFTWGEYIIWHLGPDVRVSVDGRRETVYPQEVYAENIRFLMGSAGWDDLIRRPETELIMTDKTYKSDRLMRDRRDWVVAYEDPLCEIFARPGSKAAESLQKVTLSPPPSEAFPD